MKRIFAFFAILLTVGLFNGANAFSAHQSSPAALEISATADQFVSAAHDESHHGAEQGCCWDSFCFSSSHCHHSGGSGAFLTAAAVAPTPVSSAIFELSSDHLPHLSLTYLLIDPPRA